MFKDEARATFVLQGHDGIIKLLPIERNGVKNVIQVNRDLVWTNEETTKVTYMVLEYAYSWELYEYIVQ